MWWKIVAFFYALIYLWTVFDAKTYETMLTIVGLALGLVGTFGLFLFAFNKSFLSKRFWKSFTLVYIGYVAVGPLMGGRKVIVEHGIGVFVGAVAISVAFQFFLMLGLWRLSFSTTQSRAAVIQ